KEEEQDYRYFLEGDIPWVILDPKYVQNLQKEMPESISSKKVAYTKYLPAQVANTIATDPYWSDMMNTCINTFQNEVTTKNVDYINSCITECGNIITTNLMGLEDTKEKREKSNINAKDVEDIAKAVVTKEITRNLSKIALQEMNKTGKPLSEIISELDIGQVFDESSLLGIIDEVINEEANAVNEIKEKPETVNFLVGKVMKKTKGKADPSITLQLLKSKLGI
ncbi:MAG: Asp-tRNA(Asn)/Glu-tRNA(Gln) amidotransferase GatCAB subunit B, partial [Nitrosopumilaceae archaeon]